MRLCISFPEVHYVKIKPDLVADELNLALCAPDHMRSPSCTASVWSACQGLPSGCGGEGRWEGAGGGDRKQISFLDLGPSFLFHPFTRPSILSSLPSPAPATSRGDNTPLLSSVRGVFDMKRLAAGPDVGNQSLMSGARARSGAPDAVEMIGSGGKRQVYDGERL